jgi:hypothetical protein
MATTVTRGNTAVRERPDSPEWEFNTQKITCTRTFEGMYADLLAAVPTTGTTMEGYGTLLVENVKIRRAVSGKATMTVLLETLINPADTYPEPVQPVYEIEWTQLERPIEQHPFFASLFPDPTNTAAFTADQITALTNFRAWENASDATTAAAAYAVLTDDSGGTPGFKTLAQKKMRGQTTYMLFAPVARITTLARNVTQANVCGKTFTEIAGFSELPASGSGTNYVWLSTSDRSTRTGTNGKWQRVQEWTGADSWDSDIYASGTDANEGDGGGEGGDG